MAIISLLSLTDAGPLSGSEIIPVNQNGTTKRAPVSAISGVGINSVTQGEQAIVLAGCNNRALSSFGAVVQGQNNYTAGHHFNTVLNGKDNSNLSIGYSTIAGGCNNLIAGCNATTQFSTILNGRCNSLSAGQNSLIGGCNNKINAPGGKNNAILVGDSAQINSYTSVLGNVVLAGGGAICDTSNSIMGNGFVSQIRRSNSSFMATGVFSCILSSGCSFMGTPTFGKIESGGNNSIIGGTRNTILSGSRGSILGGQSNSLTGNDSFIIGTGINGFADNTTFVNKLSATNSIHAGNGFTGTVTISSNAGDKSMVITDGIITGIS